METKIKKALIFDPYLDTLGGGERYTLVFGLELLKLGFQVEIAWEKADILHQAEDRFGLDFSGLQLNPSSYLLCKNKTSLLKRAQFTSQYDTIFWVSDGSIPLLFADNNLVHFQVPFVKLGGSKIINLIKSFFISKFVYNSEFTKKVVEKNILKNKGFVLHPPIDIDNLISSQKEKLILSVARFGSPSHPKRQDILIEAFRDFSSLVSGYKLILAGGVVEDGEMIESLKKQVGDLNIEIVTNPDFNSLRILYGKAQFFWHAAGFDVDEEKNPDKVEHFGMTTVEAMASGAIPLVIAKGGQKEILSSFPELLCNSAAQIANNTAKLTKDISAQTLLVNKLFSTAKQYSQSVFSDKISELIR